MKIRRWHVLLSMIVFGVLCVALTLFLVQNVDAAPVGQDPTPAAAPVQAVPRSQVVRDMALAAIPVARLPPDRAQALESAIRSDPLAFKAAIDECLAGDPMLWKLVDKQHALPQEYAPADLVALPAQASYRLNRAGLQLRKAAADSLERMAQAALQDGITLVASSTYRSWEYQDGLYARNVARYGQEVTDRESARPGHSQHQLGLVVDFGSIDDSFFGTKQERWLAANAGRFGWSLSFPDGYEAATGYRWESWHYRFVGIPVVDFIGRYFGGIQQYALQYLDAWYKSSK